VHFFQVLVKISSSFSIYLVFLADSNIFHVADNIDGFCFMFKLVSTNVIKLLYSSSGVARVPCALGQEIFLRRV